MDLKSTNQNTGTWRAISSGGSQAKCSGGTSGGAVTLSVLHPEGVAFKLGSLIGAQAAPEGVPVVQEDVAFPVAGLARDCLVPVGVLHTTHLKKSGPPLL